MPKILHKKDYDNGFQLTKNTMKEYESQLNLEVENIINLYKTNSDDSKKSLDNFIKNICTPYSNDKKNIYKEHDIDNTLKFNIFESISPKWYWEDFHSDILHTILNPNTVEIGRKYFVEEFVKFLELDKERFDIETDFKVEKEVYTGEINGKKGYIDLLITNENQAIIIENKINYAVDQDNQLVRYMKYVEEELGIHTYTVVYLTLIDDENKKPPLDDYDKEYEIYTNKLKDKKAGMLKEIYAVDDNKSLAKDFLPKCYKRLEEEMPTNLQGKNACNIASVYIKQYQVMLEHLGGKAYMKSTDKKIIEKIYSSRENFDAANDFMELWSNKKNIIGEILKDKICEAFSNNAGWTTKLHEYNVYAWNHKSAKYKVYCELPYQVGFASLEDKSFNEKEQMKLSEILKKIKNSKVLCNDNHWVYCQLDETQFTIIDDVINALNFLYESEI